MLRSIDAVVVSHLLGAAVCNTCLCPHKAAPHTAFIQRAESIKSTGTPPVWQQLLPRLPSVVVWSDGPGRLRYARAHRTADAEALAFLLISTLDRQHWSFPDDKG